MRRFAPPPLWADLQPARDRASFGFKVVLGLKMVYLQAPGALLYHAYT